jgi:hypothetical protein
MHTNMCAQTKVLARMLPTQVRAIVCKQASEPVQAHVVTEEIWGENYQRASEPVLDGRKGARTHAQTHTYDLSRECSHYHGVC